MTIKERVDTILRSRNDFKTDSIEKLVYVAYYMGKERGVRMCATGYNDLIAGQRERAKKSRYRHFANRIIGKKDYIYMPDYSMDVTDTFGNDETNL